MEKMYFVPNAGTPDENYKTAKKLGWKWLFETEYPIDRTSGVAGDVFESQSSVSIPKLAKEIRQNCAHCRGIILISGECFGEFHGFLTPNENKRYWKEFRSAGQLAQKHLEKTGENKPPFDFWKFRADPQ